MHKEFAFPVGCSNIRAVKGEVDYPIDSLHLHARTGEHGSVPLLLLNVGDKFSGEILEAQWKKAWDANIGGANQPFVAKLDTTNHLLLLYGEAAAAGTAGNGWINSRNPVIFIDETEIVVELESPIADTGAVADRDILFNFYLIPTFVATSPAAETDYLRIRLDVDESGLLAVVTNSISSVETTLWDGSTKDGNSARDPAADTFWKFKLVFNGKPGTIGATLSVYAKTGNSRANMEADDWEELYDSVGAQDSPFDMSEMKFYIGYPCYLIYTQNTSYYDDAGDEAKSTTLEVAYPDFQLKWDDTDTDYTGGVELWDGEPGAAGSRRVYSQDHVFSDDIYIDNGLVRVKIDELETLGAMMQLYHGGAWDTANYCWWRPYQSTPTVQISRPELLSIEKISPDEVKVKVKFHDSATPDSNIYLVAYISLKRGSYSQVLNPIQFHPAGIMRLDFGASPTARFNYAGNCKIGDNDMAIDQINTTMPDNYGVGFDDDIDRGLYGLASNLKPTLYLRAVRGQYLFWTRFTSAQIDGGTLKVPGMMIPFDYEENLFVEAEDATLGAGATVEDPDAAASALKSVKLDAQTEYVRYGFTAGTDLPAGRYLAVIRVRDTNQVADDVELTITNFTDAEQRGEQNDPVYFTATATYAYYSEPFDITDDDVTGTDSMRITVTKDLADANDIFVDYFLIIPLGDGRDWPQDLAHAAIVEADVRRRVVRR